MKFLNVNSTDRVAYTRGQIGESRTALELRSSRFVQWPCFLLPQRRPIGKAVLANTAGEAIALRSYHLLHFTVLAVLTFDICAFVSER